MDITVKMQRENKELLSFCDTHNEVYIYGGGIIANIVYEMLHGANVSPRGFLISDQPDNKEKKGLPIRCIDIVDFLPGYGVIVATKPKHHADITRKLRTKLGDRYEDDVFVFRDITAHDDELDYYGETTQNGPFFEKYDGLDGIGVEEGTDKNHMFHNYLKTYDFFLNRMRDLDIIVMELGVLNAESLRTWERYFSKAHIIGVDIDISCKRFENERIKIVTTDLSEQEKVIKLGDFHPTVIIDDASHMWSHQIKALLGLFPALNSGGIYIVEDIGTSFHNYRDSAFADIRVSTYQFLSGICELVAGKEMVVNSSLKDYVDVMKLLANDIDMISFIYGSCIIVKK